MSKESRFYGRRIVEAARTLRALDWVRKHADRSLLPDETDLEAAWAAAHIDLDDAIGWLMTTPYSEDTSDFPEAAAEAPASQDGDE